MNIRSIIHVLNIITQDGETAGMTGAEHVRAIHERSGLKRAGTIIDHKGELDVPTGVDAVEIDEDEALSLGWDLVQEDVADTAAGWPQHDPMKLGRALAALAKR